MKPNEIARLGVYVLAALVGAIFAVYGMLHNDGALITTGLTLLGTGGLAGANVTRSTPTVSDAAGDSGEYEEPEYK